MTIFIDKRLYIAKSPITGAEWGVFTDSFIPKGTVIEIARTLKLNNNHLFQNKNILNDYIFKLDEYNSLISLGFGSLYNHSENPHVNYHVTDGLIRYTTIRDIFANEEIFVSYGDNWWQNRKIKPGK